MRVIIAGSRMLDSLEDVIEAIRESKFDITLVVSGGARGVDSLGEIWAACRGIPIERFPADWRRYGRSAGMRRNVQMAKHADALVAVWDGHSKGTQNMIEEMKKRQKPVFVYLAENCPKNPIFHPIDNPTQGL